MPATRAVLTTLALTFAACSRPAVSPSPSPAAGDPGRPLPSPMPEVVARVNGEPIRIQQILPMAKMELDRVPDADRDRLKAEALRRALQRYVDRELLVQEALARGLQADSRQVDWAYDQMRREHADEKGWEGFLARQGMSPESVRTELRSQHLVDALVEQEVREAVKGEVEPAALQHEREEAQAALLARLRAKARIELLL